MRDDTGVYEGWEVPIHYDPMISKLVVWGPDRPAALRTLNQTLAKFDVEKALELVTCHSN